MFVFNVFWWLKTGSCWFFHQKCVTTYWKSVNKVCFWILNCHIKIECKFEAFWFVFESFCYTIFTNFPKKKLVVGGGGVKKKRAEFRCNVKMYFSLFLFPMYASQLAMHHVVYKYWFLSQSIFHFSLQLNIFLTSRQFCITKWKKFGAFHYFIMVWVLSCN